MQRGQHQKILNTEQKSLNTENTESKNKTKILEYWTKNTDTEIYWIFFSDMVPHFKIWNLS